METVIERQAIRAALAFAVASAHGQSPDAIADMRDEAAHLIGLCIKDGVASDVLRQWCDDAASLVQRLTSSGTLPESDALGASAAVLRLRLAVAQQTELPPRHSKRTITPPKTTDTKGSPKVLMEFIANHPNMRVKDLLDALRGTLSSRTIKRYLKELSDAHMLQRIVLTDGGVAYRVDTEQ